MSRPELIDPVVQRLSQDVLQHAVDGQADAVTGPLTQPGNRCVKILASTLWALLLGKPALR